MTEDCAATPVGRMAWKPSEKLTGFAMERILVAIEAYLDDSGGDYDMDRFDAWFRHRLWRRCPVEGCEWCAREASHAAD